MIGQGATRDSVVLAFGGGVVGDLAGFCSSILLRGVELVMVPTTLLAMVDSSVGGKTAVNIGEGKNLLGTFHQPALVVVDPTFLETLPRRELKAGSAEIVKAALLRGGRFWTRAARTDWPSTDERDLADAIRLKASVVAADELERDARRVLNLGHTLAHGLEAATDYRYYRHGEAVAVGLMFAAELSEREAGLSADTAASIHRIAEGLARRPSREGIPLPTLRSFLERDKKNRRGLITFVLLESPGKPIVRSGVPWRAVKSAHGALRKRGWL